MKAKCCEDPRMMVSLDAPDGRMEVLLLISIDIRPSRRAVKII